MLIYFIYTSSLTLIFPFRSFRRSWPGLHCTRRKARRSKPVYQSLSAALSPFQRAKSTWCDFRTDWIDSTTKRTRFPLQFACSQSLDSWPYSSYSVNQPGRDYTLELILAGHKASHVAGSEFRTKQGTESQSTGASTRAGTSDNLKQHSEHLWAP